MNPFIEIIRLMQRLQQRNRFVDVEPESELTLAETHLLKQCITQPELTQVEYKKLFSLPQSHIGRLIDRLQKRGLLNKYVNPKDSRFQILTLTDKGKEVVRLSDKVVTECYLSFARLLSNSEKKELVRFFKEIADGYGHPAAIKRPEETEYSLHQRRITRCFKLLGKKVLGSNFNSTQWHVLSALKAAHSQVSPGMLAKMIGVTNGNITTVTKDLLKKKLISSSANNLDKRAVDIKITEKGIKAVEDVELKAAEELKNALRNHSIKQCRHWLAIFRKYIIDSDQSLTIPELDISLVLFSDRNQKTEARARLISELVAQNQSLDCPAHLASDEHITIGFRSQNQIVSLFDLQTSGKEIIVTSGYLSQKLKPAENSKIIAALKSYLSAKYPKIKIICSFKPLDRHFKYEVPEKSSKP